jgi:hypothetical protein
MGSNNKPHKKSNQFKHKKRNTAVTFDSEDRNNYLNNMIGAKKRRR